MLPSHPLCIEVEQEEDGRWIAEIAELTGVLAYGSTRSEAIARVEALALRVLADRLDHANPSRNWAPSWRFPEESVAFDNREGPGRSSDIPRSIRIPIVLVATDLQEKVRLDTVVEFPPVCGARRSAGIPSRQHALWGMLAKRLF